MRDYPLKRYGTWAGNPEGYPYDPDYCAYQIWDKFVKAAQCSRKRGHGPDKLFCKQHAKIIEERS